MSKTATKELEIEFMPPASAGALVASPPAAKAVRRSKQPTSIIQLIADAARDPRVDIDKMERLIRMQKDMQATEAEIEFDNAMAAAQEEMEPIRADLKNSQTSSRYASIHALDRAIRPIYTKHGFSLTFTAADGAPADHVRIVCRVAHRGGHRERPYIDMPADGKGAKGGDVMTKTHATGSATTYGRRYLKQMIFDLAIDRDDDGNAAGGHRAGPAGSAGGGTDFRPAGRRGFTGRSWTDDDPDLVDHTREKGTMPGKQPAPKAAAPAPAKATTPPPLTRAEKIKAGADRRIKILQEGIEGHPWTRQSLDQFWADETEWHSVIRDEAPKQFERFEQAFLEAKEKL